MKILKGRVTGTFSDDVEVWLDDEDLDEMDDEDKKDALRDAWQYTEFEDMEVDEESIEVKDG